LIFESCLLRITCACLSIVLKGMHVTITRWKLTASVRIRNCLLFNCICVCICSRLRKKKFVKTSSSLFQHVCVYVIYHQYICVTRSVNCLLSMKRYESLEWKGVVSSSLSVLLTSHRLFSWIQSFSFDLNPCLYLPSPPAMCLPVCMYIYARVRFLLFQWFCSV